MAVTVITATTGRPSLIKCIESVAKQAGPYVGKIQHLIIADGPESHNKVKQIRYDASIKSIPLDVIELPQPVGNDRWNGHRMYAAGTYLAEGEHVMYLDDDNTIDEYHIQHCLETIHSNPKLGWVYSLRKIVDQEGKFICHDDCESLGPDYPTIINPKDFLVDVNCYFIHKTLAIYMTPLWYRRARDPGVMEVDRVLVSELRKISASACTGKYTVNYAADSTELSVSSEFFLNGNAAMAQRYPGGFPWRK